MTIEYPCGICKNEVKQDDKSVQCDLCNKWNHIECVDISSAYYEKLQNDTKPWYCPNCSKELPFSDVRDKDLHNTIHVQSTPQTHFTNVPNKKSKGLIHKFQQLNNLFDQSENTISCDYYDLKDFQKIKIKQQDFSLLHLNISSLSCHINDLVNFLALLNTKFDVICITETRLSHKNPITTNIELPGYNIEQTPTESSAGGTLIYISQNLSYKRRTDLQICCSKELESVFIEVMVPNKQSYILGTIYKHPSMKHFKFNNEYMEELLRVITHENKNCILTGDFNLNLLKHAKSPGVSKFLENLLSHNFMPQITLPTRITEKTATLIDNILINNNVLNCISGNITTSISDHLPQFIVLDSLLGTSTDVDSSQILYRSFKNFNEENFSNDINEINWAFATENNDINLGFETLLRLIDKTLDKHAPVKKCIRKEEKLALKPWVTNGIKKSISVRDKLYKEMIRAKNHQIKKRKHEIYKTYRNKIVDLLRVNRKRHYQKYFEENKKSSRALWQGIHDIVYSKKSKKNNTPSSLLIDGKTITNPKDMAESFNNFFTSIGAKLQSNIPPTRRHYFDYLKHPNPETFFISPTTPDEIENIIKSLKSSKCVGPNSIPTKMLHLIKDKISIPLSELINKSFSAGCFPNICKTAKVIPIFKTESRLLCNNYRPISLLSNISKIIEKIMHQRLNKFLEESNCFYNLQFGFRLNLSTNNALLSIIENIQTDLDNGDFAAGVFIDLKKAFDTVDHDILLKKLEYYGVRGLSRDWFQSYLKNRKQFVSISNSTSNTNEITTGVPQGSVLGPLLFLLYINDLHRSVKYSKTYHFADDTNIMQSNKSLDVLSKNLNKDLKSLSQWLKANKLCLNISKTELIIFHRNTASIDHTLKLKLDGKRLGPSQSVKYLGVILDEHLQWNDQIAQVKIKLNRAIGILSKIRHNANPTILKVVYHSLFGSNLLYGAQLWGQTNLANQNSIQVLQNRAIRKICFKKRNEPVSEDFKKIGILKFHDLIKLQNCLFICQLEQDEQLAKSFLALKHCGDNHNYQTRSTTKRLLDTPLLNTDTYGTQSTKYNCIADWNSFRKTFKDLPLSECSRFKVKKLLKQLFLNKY